MRYLVTGGCGFIGSHLVDSLVARGDDVLVVDDLSSGKRENLNSRARLIEGSILDSVVMQEALRQVDVCIHLAAIASVSKSTTDWVGSHRVNLTAFIMLLHKVRELGTRIPILYASSAAIYGDQSSMPIREEVVPRPLSAYGADKLACEHQARVAGRVFGIPTVGFRFFNVYGPRQDPSSPYSGVISVFAEAAISDLPPTIHGDGKQSRDFIYVSDIVGFLLAGVPRASSAAPVFNACTGVRTSIENLAEVVMAKVECRHPVKRMDARPGDIRESIGSVERATIDLDYAARISLDEGLSHTLSWLIARRH